VPPVPKRAQVETLDPPPRGLLAISFVAVAIFATIAYSASDVVGPLIFALLLVWAWGGPNPHGRRFRSAPVPLELVEGRLRIGDSVIARADLESGLELPPTAAEGSRVLLQLPRGRAMLLGFAEPNGAAVLLEALGLQAAQRAIVIEVGGSDALLPRIFFAVIGAFAAVCALVASAGVVAAIATISLVGLFGAGVGAFLFGAVSILCFRFVNKTTLTIGTDRVEVEELFWVRRRLPAAGLRVEVHGGGVTLSTSEERPRSISIDTRGEEEARAVAARIEAATRGGFAVVDPALLRRAGRALPDWRDALRALVASSAYRSGVDAESLARAVEDPSLDAEVRVAAAFAVAAEGEPFRARVRLAAGAVADERFRIALERAADGELDEEVLSQARSTAADDG
jgi:hypothetical protein